MSDRPADGDRREPDERQTRTNSGSRTVEYVTQSVLRLALAITGFVILLFGLGQAFGMDLLGEVEALIGSPMGQWLVVAFAGLLLILIALSGWRTTDTRTE